MAISRAVSWKVEANRGQNVWGVLCRAALRSIDFAADVFGMKETEGRIERTELLMGYGVTPSVPSSATTVDWAKLGEFDRGRVVREFWP